VRTDKNLDARGSFGQVSFDYKVLRDSTGNFDRKNMLGKGGFGEVYKGRLPDGRVVAVKKLNGRQTTQAAEEFLTEVRLISSVRHRNLVRLLGCCKRGKKRLLVYEFMSNNSLDKHLFGEIRNALSWENRLNIIVGTARGLAYLHGESNVRIIHRDIKCANILLDDRLHPKIADFGLAKFFPESQTHVSTRVGGTIGYTAPEYAVHGQLTEKADVYSYGIMVLEIVSGRKCVDARLPAPLQLLLEWAWNQFEQNEVLDIVDPLLEGQYPREQALRVITIALLCTQGSWTQRPAMSQVVSMLTDNSESTVQPTRPAFIDAAADRPQNFTSIPESPTSAAGAPTQGSHGSISVSFLPR
jgi:serine/threonine protein kinase